MQYLTVTALTKYIKTKLEGDKHLVMLYLKGEISNFKRHSRGHLYFTLKDEESSISAIVFAKEASMIAFEPKEGDKVLVKGRISVYQPSGTYSIQIQTMEPDGIGDLYLKYEQLKKTLEEKGYFRAERKKPIPKFPTKIGVVTSPTGAVIQDIRQTVERRYRLTEIHLYPALVQGPESAASIARMIRLANEINDVDVLIVGRGGGSIEDLWGFNEIVTIEAILNSKIPVISAVGHETDFTISDFVADMRAPTPTAAAELATPHQSDLKDMIIGFRQQLEKRLAHILSDHRTTLLYLDQRLDLGSPQALLKRHHEALQRIDEGLERTYRHILSKATERLMATSMRMRSPNELIDRLKNMVLISNDRMETRITALLAFKNHQFRVLLTALNALNPLQVMEKGFAVVSSQGRVVTSVTLIHINDSVDIRFKDGLAEAIITGKKGL